MEVDAVVVDAENYDLKVLNRTLDPVDFREFMHITPESTFNAPVTYCLKWAVLKQETRNC